MTKRRSSSIKRIEFNSERWSKISYFILLFLIVEIFACLIIGWLSGDKEYNAISDNVVTSLLQNYNYLLASACLIPVIAFLYTKLQKRLYEMQVSESEFMMYGFFGIIILFIAIVSICSIVYPINSSTWYGKNSYVTVAIFLCPVVTLVLESILCGILELINLIKKKEFWKSIRRNLPIILLVMFLIWTFISCMLAPGAADDVIGAEKANSVGASPSDVLAKTLNGCYNLKDGFWAFLMYGSFMLVAIFVGRDKVKEKKFLIKSFVIAMLVLSIITIGVTAYGGLINQRYQEEYETYKNSSAEFSYEKELTKEDFEDYAESQANIMYEGIYVFPQRAIFRNSNHFAYILCMAIISACVLAITENGIYKKALYIFCYIILLYMLIINDTFGGYLGVFVALVFLLIYGIVSLIYNSIKNSDEGTKKTSLQSFSMIIFVILLFVGATFGIRNEYGKPLAMRNIEGFIKDVGIFGNYVISEENATQTDISELDESISKAGSGRGETWLKVWELVKQRPLFGYGLECLLFQFSGQFSINEGRTHNLLFQLLGTVGIPGTIFYFLALVIVFIRLLKNWKTWNDVEKICFFAIIAYIITAFTGNSTYYTSPYFMMFLGFVVMIPWNREEK